MTTYNEILDYLIVFTSLTIFKAFCSGIHQFKMYSMPITRYETESTLTAVMKIQIQFNVFILHSLLFFNSFENLTNQESGKIRVMIIISTCIYAMVVILTDYRWLLKIYRYENRLLRQEFPLIKFISIQIFMMVSGAILLTIQWFMVPIISDIMCQILFIYKVPNILKSHSNNQIPNITYFCFLEDYCILLFYTYYRGCPFNITNLKDNLGACISITVLLCIQQCVLLYQYHVKPQLYQMKSQIDIFAEEIRESKLYQNLEENQFNQECGICLQGVEAQNTLQIQLQPTNQLVITQCGHKFHESCLIVWLRVKKQCPLCRRQY